MITTLYATALIEKQERQKAFKEKQQNESLTKN